MRSLSLCLALFLAALFSSFSANAYVIHNMTGIEAYFEGEGCYRCWSGKLADGEKGACPGSESGCRGETYVYTTDDTPDNQKYFGMPGYHSSGMERQLCGYGSPVRVTAHGDVYLYRDHIQVDDDNGKTLYNGPWVIFEDKWEHDTDGMWIYVGDSCRPAPQ
jgi:hypothetical protein